MSEQQPRITAIEASAYTVPTDQPEADATLAWDSTTMVVVEARASGGPDRDGPASGTGWTWAPAAAARVVTDVLAPVVTGRSALAPRDAQAAMVDAVRNAGRVGLVGMAISAVDIALWDLAARVLDRPLTSCWGAERHPVPVYGSGGFTTYSDQALREQLGGWVAAGIPRVKIKIGESRGHRVERDLARTALAREVVGAAVELYVDANGGYTVGQARRIGRRLDALGVTWFEEPVSSDDVGGLAAVRAGVAADVTAGEYGYDLAGFARLVPVVDCLQVDVTRCGGYTEWFRIAALAAAHGVDVSAHCAPYLSLPVAVATPRLRHLEWFHDHVRIVRELVDGYADPVEGALVPPNAPGHGLRLRRAAAQRFRVA
jgi:L-alanine-DL-glutamate epimerase-like enolase superfamily enzyme